MYIGRKLLNTLPKRIVSAVVDQVVLVVLAVIIFLTIDALPSTHGRNSNDVYAAIVLFTIWINKDIYFGRSIGKYFNGVGVISVRTGNLASPVQCALRNLFLLIWPLEGIIILISPEKRIGDFAAGTRVAEHVEMSGEMKWPYAQAIVSVIASGTLIFYFFTFVDSLGILS